jgi:peptide/nickel transport system substrate-binding protein
VIRVLLASALLVAGCTCKPKPSPPDAGPDADWLAGRLAPETSTPKKGGTLVVRLALEPNGLTRLHDQFSEGTMTRITVGPIYETLARSIDGVAVPSLATKWVENDLTLTISLREGVTFHDGAPLTSADVKATLDLVMDSTKPTAGFRSSLETLKSIDAPDAHTVVVRWSKPSFLATHTVLTALPILPAHALTGDFDTLPLHRAPIGTGPFKFERWEPGVSLSYVRADERASLDRIVFRFVKDDVAAMQAFEKGEFDVMTRVSPQAWRALESQPWAWRGYQRVRFTENAYVWIGFNQRLPLFANVQVRRALAAAYPADVIEHSVDLGLEPRTSCPWASHSKSCDPNVKPIVFDLDVAKAVLADAGWNDSDHDGVLDRRGQRFSFSFLIAAQSVKMNKLVPLYVDTLKQVGVEARISTVDVSAYMSRVRAHDFEAMALSWSAADVVQDNFDQFHSSQTEQGSNYVGYRNPEVDALLERIRGELDPLARTALEREAHRRIFEDQAYLFMGQRPSLDAVKRSVHGVRPSLAGYDFAAMWLEPTP